MTDIDAPMRYSDPVADRTGRDAGVGLVVLLALALGAAAVGLAMVSREMAEEYLSFLKNADMSGIDPAALRQMQQSYLRPAAAS